MGNKSTKPVHGHGKPKAADVKSKVKNHICTVDTCFKQESGRNSFKLGTIAHTENNHIKVLSNICQMKYDLPSDLFNFLLTFLENIGTPYFRFMYNLTFRDAVFHSKICHQWYESRQFNESSPISIVIIGEAGVGKSQIIHNFNALRHEYFDTRITSDKSVRIGKPYRYGTHHYPFYIDNLRFNVETSEIGHYELSLETLMSNRKMNDICIVMYSAIDPPSFDKAKSIIEKLKSVTSPKPCAIVLAGNQCDLYDYDSVYSANDQIGAWAVELFCADANIPFSEVSAYTSGNVVKLFEIAIKEYWAVSTISDTVNNPFTS